MVMAKYRHAISHNLNHTYVPYGASKNRSGRGTVSALYPCATMSEKWSVLKLWLASVRFYTIEI